MKDQHIKLLDEMILFIKRDKTPIMRLDEYDVKWFKYDEYLELPPLEE